MKDSWPKGTKLLALLPALLLPLLLVLTACTPAGPTASQALVASKYRFEREEEPAITYQLPGGAALSKGDLVITYELPGGAMGSKLVTERCWAEAQIGKPLPDSCQAEATPRPIATPRPPGEFEMFLFASARRATRFNYVTFTVSPLELLYLKGWQVQDLRITLRANDEQSREVWVDKKVAPSPLLLIGEELNGEFAIPSSLAWSRATVEAEWRWCKDGKCTERIRKSVSP